MGVPPTAAEAIATLVNIAAVDRPEDGIEGLPRILMRSIGRDVEDLYRRSDAGDLDDGVLRQKMVEACRSSVAASVERSTDSAGRVSEVNPMFAGLQNMFGGSPMLKALKEGGFPDVTDEQIEKTFGYLEFCLKQIVADNEMGALLQGLNAEYITPGTYIYIHYVHLHTYGYRWARS